SAQVPILTAVACVLAAACATPTTVPLLDAAGIPVTATPHDAVPLEVVTRATGVKDPLVVHGAEVAYGDMETALGYAVRSAAITPPGSAGSRGADRFPLHGGSP